MTQRGVKTGSQEVCEKCQFLSNFMVWHGGEYISRHNDRLTSQATQTTVTTAMKMTCNNLCDWSRERLAALFEDCTHINSLWSPLNIIHIILEHFHNIPDSIFHMSCSLWSQYIWRNLLSEIWQWFRPSDTWVSYYILCVAYLMFNSYFHVPFINSNRPDTM